MPSTTFTRTAATLGVLAGLFATAGPAIAVSNAVKDDDVDAVSTQFRGEVIGLEPTMKAPAGPDATASSLRTR